MLINSGKLGGVGQIVGSVTVGTGSGGGVVLSPGQNEAAVGTLRINHELTFQADGSYEFGVDTDTTTADEVIPNGVTIDDGAQFDISSVGSGVLPLDTVFTAINNTAATPIAGTFSNLPDGGTFTIDSNTFQVDYEGGDGNDLTLTIVP